jgi:hypothetical protein
MTVKVVGWAGAKTAQALLNAQAALSEHDPRGHVECVDDVHAMLAMGVVQKPAVIINGKLKIAGRVPSVHEIGLWIQQEKVEGLAA